MLQGCFARQSTALSENPAVSPAFAGRPLFKDAPSMQRRQFHQTSALAALLYATGQQAWALSLGDLSSADASKGLKAALAQGAQAAVALLGRPDGFLGNPRCASACRGIWTTPPRS